MVRFQSSSERFLRGVALIIPTRVLAIGSLPGWKAYRTLINEEDENKRLGEQLPPSWPPNKFDLAP